MFSEEGRTDFVVAVRGVVGGVVVLSPGFSVQHVNCLFRLVILSAVISRRQPGTSAGPAYRRLDFSQVLLHQHVWTLENLVCLIFEDAVGLVTDRAADKVADVGPWPQLAMLLLGFERPRPAPLNVESRDVGASTRQVVQRCHVQPGLAGLIDNMDDRGHGCSTQIFVRSGIGQRCTHALHQQAINPLRFAVPL